MRARRALVVLTTCAIAAAGSVVLLGAGGASAAVTCATTPPTVRTPAAHRSAVVPSCATVAITDAPSELGVSGDARTIDATGTNSSASSVSPVRWYVDVSGDGDITPDAVFVQALVDGTWQSLDLSTSGSDLAGGVGDAAGFTLGAGATSDLHLRLIVTDSVDAEVLTVTVRLSTTTAPGLVPGEDVVLGSDSADIDLVGLEVGAPDPIHAVLDVPKVITATTENHTGSDYEQTFSLPVFVPGTGSALKAARVTTRLRSGSDALRRLQAAAAATDTTVEFRDGGSWVDIMDVNDYTDLPLVDIADGGSASLKWRFTFSDPELVGSTQEFVGWFALRSGLAFPESPAPQLRSAHGTRSVVATPDPEFVYIAGFGAQDLLITDATAEPTATVTSVDEHPTGDGNGDGNGNGEADGTLPATGSDTLGMGGAALALLLAGFAALVATRRRHPGTHR